LVRVTRRNRLRMEPVVRPWKKGAIRFQWVE